MSKVDPERLVFLDESGSHIAMTPHFARAPRGERAIGRVPRNRGSVLTMLGALSIGGVEAMMTVEGGTSAAVFRQFVDAHLAPILRKGDVVVMDNLGAHHATGIRDAIEATGASVLYQPPYSPDLNPIELCWSKIKEALRRIGARTVAQLRNAVHDATARVSALDSVGWFTHCGYAGQPE